MDKEQLILKWLDNNLTPQELEAFKALEDYDAIIKLSNYSQGFKAPNFDIEANYNAVLSKVNKTPKANKNWWTPVLKIAAILAICFGAYYYTTTLDTVIVTQLAEKSIIELPDNSSVNLNAQSSITYNTNQWTSKTREVSLKGEAFFKVEKGSTFNVITPSGTVTVIGTQFNVKQRLNYFEVTCFEGIVSVQSNDKKTILNAGQSFLIINNKTVNRSTVIKHNPDWIYNVSSFISVPLNQVLAEFERQYNVKIDAKNFDQNVLFSGKFTHDDITIALQSITQPLQLQYKKVNNTIILTRE